MAELGGNFYDSLKSITSGYASFDYEEGPLRKADLVRLDLLLNGEPVDALARIVHRYLIGFCGGSWVEQGPARKADLVRLDLLLNGEPVDALARIVHRYPLGFLGFWIRARMGPPGRRTWCAWTCCSPASPWTRLRASCTGALGSGLNLLLRARRHMEGRLALQGVAREGNGW